MEETIAIVAASKKASLTIKEQLDNILGNYANFKGFSLLEWEEQTAYFPLVLISTEKFIKYVVPRVKSQTDFLIIRRTISKQALKKVLEIPKGEKVLIVNDHIESVDETISLLYEVGINHLDFIPYYPGSSPLDYPYTAITPNEAELVPRGINKTVNIGERLLDVNTLINTLTRLELLDSKAYKLISNYGEKIVSRYSGLQTTLNDLENTRSVLHQAIQMIDNGVIAYDKYHEILFINETAKKILLSHSKNQIGKRIIDLLQENHIAINLSNPIEDFVCKTSNNNIILNNHKLSGEQGGVLTVQFADKIRDAGLKIRTQLKEKGHHTKYDFQTIISQSPKMKETITLSKKIASSDLNVLILGESGTGKELFAHSIHHYSDRENYPFVAVNCSALPDSLLESELFGYEDGAFTGAKKGGKPGLFEQAHKGTIFLDEIGDIAPNLQSRLLRVLEQKEIIKVGGSRVISVDVRIISATNRDLSILVKENIFRADLYFRLKVMQVNLPPLRERKEDLPLLIDYFLGQRKIKNTIPSKIIDALHAYHWPGNIRELKNMVDYLTVMQDDIDDISKLPFESPATTSIHLLNQGNDTENMSNLLSPNKNEIHNKQARPYKFSNINPKDLVLNIIYAANSKGKGIGRRNIIENAKSSGVLFTENEMRTVLEELKLDLLIEINLGRTGCKLTEKGYNYITN